MDIMAALGLTIDGRGAIRTLNQFTGSAHNAGRATEHFDRTTKNLTASLRVLGGYFGIRQLVEYADTWTLINARINTVTDSTNETAAVQERLYAISQRTRNTLAAVSVLYTRLALSSNELGRTQNELLKVTEAVNAGVLVSGATGVEAAQSMRQLAQAFSKGKLDGDEFRTVMEAMPTVAQAIADKLHVTRGALLELAPAGKITAQTIVAALLEAHDELVKLADEMPVTIGQAFGMLQNAVTHTMGILNHMTGVSRTLGAGIQYVVKHVRELTGVVAGLTAAWIANRVAVLGFQAVMALLQFYEWTKLLLEFTLAIRKMGDALAVASLFGGGLLKIAAAMLALGAGLIAYRLIVKQIDEATEKWNKQVQAGLADLDTVKGARVDPIDEEAIKKAKEFADLVKKTTQSIEDMLRTASQEVVLAGMDEAQQKRTQIHFDAVNKAVEARRELTGGLLSAMEQAILAEERLKLEALETADAIEAVKTITEERLKVLEQFAENFQRSFADTFFNITRQGIQSFADMFKAIRDMFLRLLAEMAAAKVMQRFGPALLSVLGGIMGQPVGLAAAQAKAAEAAAKSMGRAAAAGGTGGVVPVAVEGITVTAQRSLLSTMASFIGPALGGFAVGGMLGKLTSNSVHGGLLGAGGGAAMGAALGSILPGVGTVVGAGVGALTGAIGGWISSSKRHEEELRKNREALEANSKRLEALRFQVEGGNTAQKYGRALDILSSGFPQDPTSRAAIVQNKKDFDFLRKVAEELGITIELDGHIIDGALDQLGDAINLSIQALLEFGMNLNDVRARIDAYNQLFDVDMTPQQVIDDTYQVLKELSPKLLEALGLSNVDTVTKEGREQLKLGLQSIFNLIMSGQLTPELLGSFTDKGQLLDAILAVSKSLKEMDKELLKVTTDFPRAMDIVYYEQKFGSYGNGSRITPPPTVDTGTPRTPREGGASQPVFTGDIIIQSFGNETGEELLKKLEDAAAARRGRGGTVFVERNIN
jgi:tape measure domain-containing protein